MIRCAALFAGPLLALMAAVLADRAGQPEAVAIVLGGFILSQAMERSGAHRRIAPGMIRLFGADSPRRLVMGFMAAALVHRSVRPPTRYSCRSSRTSRVNPYPSRAG